MAGTATDTRSQAAGLLSWPAIVLIVAAFVLPVGLIVVQSITDPQPGLQNYQWLLTDSAAQGVLVRTILIAGLATVITGLLAYPYAYAMATTTPLVRGIMMVIVLLPFWTSLMVRAFAWIIILQRNGLLNAALTAMGFEPVTILGTNTAVLIGMCQVLMPFMVLPMVSGMLGIDSALPRAAQIMGAPRWKAFFTVYLPLSLPGVFAGSLIVFILSLGFYVTPALLGSPREQLVPNALYSQVLELLAWGRGGALAVALLLLVGAVFLVLHFIARILGVRIGRIGGVGL